MHVVACATTCFLVPTVWKNMGLTLQIVFLFSWGYSTLQGFFKDDFGLNFKYSELPIMMNWLKNVVASPFCPTLEVLGLQGYQWWDDNQLTCTAFLPFFGGTWGWVRLRCPESALRLLHSHYDMYKSEQSGKGFLNIVCSPRSSFEI